MELIQRRPPRAYSGERASGLREIYSSTHGTLGIISLERVVSENKRYNTKAYVLVSRGDGISTKDVTKSDFYNRQTIASVFTLAGIKKEDGYKIEAASSFQHPIEQAAIIKLLNGKYRCDFSDKDIVVTYINGNYYSIEALENSLGYIGKATLAVGIAEEIPLIPTEHALFDSEQSLIGKDVELNGRTYPIGSERLFTEEHVIFQEFSKSDGNKLTYFLNLNEVALTAKTTVDISSRPADVNLNETARPSNGTFILSEFVRATTEIPATPLDVPSELRFTSWLNTIDKIDAIFDIKINGTLTTLKNIALGLNDAVDIDTANNILILSNKTYQPVDIYLRAKTISLPALEDPRFSFIRLEQQPALVGGYEVYGYRLASLVKPLENLRVKHWIPTQPIYTTLLTRLAQVVGTDPVVTEENGIITEIVKLNLNHDDFEKYQASVSIEGSTKEAIASIARNGLMFLDVFAINKEQWEILQRSDLNEGVIQVIRTNQGREEVASMFSVNQLLARGIWDTETEQFIFAFTCRDDWEGNTKFAYSGNTLFLPTMVSLITNRDLTKFYVPTLKLLEQSKWDVLKVEHPQWATAFGQDAFIGTPQLLNHVGDRTKFEFTYNVVPTAEEIEAGFIEVGFLTELSFHQDIKPILDRAMQRYNPLDQNKALIKLASTSNPAMLEAYVLTYGQYRNIGFQDFYHDEDTGIYTLIVRCKTRININPNFDLGNGPTEVDRVDNIGKLQLSFDADSIYGTSFNGGDNIDSRDVINNIAFNSPNLESPEIRIASDQATLFANPLIQAKLQPGNINANGPTDHLIIEQTANSLEVNIKRIPDATAYWVVMECMLTNEQYAKMDKFTLTNGETVISGVDFKAQLVVIGGKYYYIQHCFADSSFRYVLNLTTDVDGGELVYVPKVSVITIDINVIEPPLALFMLVDQTANDASQQRNVIMHAIEPGFTPIEIPLESPFDAFKAPSQQILDLSFTQVDGQTVVDGNVLDIDERTIVGVEFKLYVTEDEVVAKPDNDDLVATISKVGTNWKLDLPRSLFKRHFYVKDGDVYMFLLFKLAEAGGFNGEYVIDVDWDGLGTDDEYVINGNNHNSFYKQRLPFTLDLNAQFLPRDLDSPRLFWTTLSTQRDLYAKMVNGEIPAIQGQNQLLPVDLIDFGKSGTSASISAIIPDGGQAYTGVWFAETTVNDETFPLMTAGNLKLKDPEINNGEWVDLGNLASIKNQLIKHSGKYYLPHAFNLTEQHKDETYLIDLDAEGKKYAPMSSQLETFVTTKEQIQSPSFGWANNQFTLLNALKTGAMVYGPIDVSEVIEPARVTYGSVTATDFNAEIAKNEGRFMVVFLEFLGDQAQFDLLNSDTTLTTKIEGQNEVTLNWQQLQGKLVTYAGKQYLPMTYNESTGLENERFQLDVDGVGKLYLPSSKDLGVNLQWFDPSASPKLIIAPNQADLLTAAKLGVITRPELIPAELAEPAGVTYSISETSMTATYTGATAKRIPLFAELIVTTDEFSKLGPNTKITIHDSEGTPHVIPWATFVTGIINYNNKRYLLIDPGITEGETGFHYIIDTDGDALRYTPTTSIATANIGFIQSVPSPTMKVASNQPQLLEAIHTAEINTGKPASSYVTLDEVIYGNITDTTLNAEVVIGANLILPVFNEFVISTSDYAKLNANSTVKLNTNGNEVLLNGNVLKSSLISHGGKYYLLTEMVKETPAYTLSLTIDLDGDGRQYLETTSSTGFNTTWVVPKPSPKFTYAANQIELLNSIKSGSIPFEDVFPEGVGFNADKLVDSDSVEYVSLTDSTLAANIRKLGDDIRFFPTFLKLEITTEEFENIPTTGTIKVNGNSFPLNEALAKVFSVGGSYYMMNNFQPTDGPNSNDHITFEIDYDGGNPYYTATTSNLNSITNYLDQLESPVFTIAQNMLELNDLIIDGTIVGPAEGATQKLVLSEDINIIAIDDSSVTMKALPSDTRKLVAVTVKVSLSDADYEAMGDDATLTITTSNENVVVDGVAFKDMVYAYDSGTGKSYYLTFLLDETSSQMLKNSLFLIDIDGPNPTYMPQTSLINVDLSWVAGISCENAFNATQCMRLVGSFKVKVDGVEINNGTAMNQAQLASYLNSPAGEEYGIAVDNCIDISCDGAPNKTQCVSLTGDWDVYIGDNKVGSNVVSSNLPTLFENNGQGVVMVGCGDAPVVGAPHAAVIGLTADMLPDIALKLNDQEWTGIHMGQVVEQLEIAGVMAIPMYLASDCIPTSLGWDIPENSPVRTWGNRVYAGWIDDSLLGEGTVPFNINGEDVQIPYNMVITSIPVSEFNNEPTYYLFNNDEYGLGGKVFLDGPSSGTPYYVRHIELTGHNKQNGAPNTIDSPSNLTIGKLPSSVTDKFTATDVDYFGTIFGDNTFTIHSCSTFTNPPM